MWKKRLEINRERKRFEQEAEELHQRIFDRAVNLLAYRPRSVGELRERLLEKDWVDERIVDDVIEKLREYNYLNDKDFAQNFATSQIRQKPIGKRILRQKLAQKKLDAGTIDETLKRLFDEVSEEELIARAVQKRLRLKGVPRTREETKKFYDYLLRQGFSHDLVSMKMREIVSGVLDESE
jgi:regulatory protein